MHTSRLHTFPMMARIVIAACIGLLASASQVSAQIASQTRAPVTSVDRSFNPAPKDCADVRWSSAALQAFPSIGAACQAVEQRNGRTFVKLQGEVESVKEGGKRIRVDFEDGGELTFTPSQQMTLYLDGERTAFSEVRDGMQLNFYVPEDRLQAELQPDPARVAFIVVPLDLRLDSATAPGSSNLSAMNQLPATASMWPWIGSIGAALLVLALTLTTRRRFHR
ncbi:MAG: LPXTG cell wall anchor domain-containing protein [Pseudomonadota bacterium]|nr:LPXTG cell wall anchor domain-containing protein [Pseudomonadota bacterium]